MTVIYLVCTTLSLVSITFSDPWSSDSSGAMLTFRHLAKNVVKILLSQVALFYEVSA